MSPAAPRDRSTCGTAPAGMQKRLSLIQLCSCVCPEPGLANDRHFNDWKISQKGRFRTDSPYEKAPIGAAAIPLRTSRQRNSCSRGSASLMSETFRADHRRSAITEARGQVRGMKFAPSTCSPHMLALPPIIFSSLPPSAVLRLQAGSRSGR